VRAEQHGHPEQALALLTELLDPARADELGEQRAALPDIVRLALAVGDEATARTAAEAGTTLAGTEPTRSQDAADRHCRGLLDGDPEQLGAAADIYRRVGRPVQLAHALEDAAVVLAQHDDFRRARAAHAEAVEIYTGLGADWDLQRLATRLRPYGLRRPSGRRRPATGWDALTVTELKIAQLVAAGNSNPDIAAACFLSRRTVEVHVSHILAKLGARSRIELARARSPANSSLGK
jgi:DNA-binding CsgD family transcriptional regulator